MQTQIALSNTPRLVKFTGVLSNQIAPIWNDVSDFIQGGLAEGEELTGIMTRLAMKECQLWIAKDGDKIIAACITELVTIGNRKVCNVITVGGIRMNEWLGMSLTTIEAWARENSCTAMRFPEIRPGWQRVLKDYHITKINLEKAL